MEMTPLLWQKLKWNWRVSWRGWKRRVKNLAWNSTLEKLDYGNWSHHFMTNRRGKAEVVADFLSWTTDGDCSHEIKIYLLLRRKAMTNLDSILKNRVIILLKKVHIVRTMVFPVVKYRCESWTIKKAEHRRIDAFKLWCWRRLESSLNSKEIQPINPKENQLWILIGSTGAEPEAPILWPPDSKRNWLIGKDPDAGKD